MRITAVLAGVFVCAAILATSSERVSAETLNHTLLGDSISLNDEFKMLELVEKTIEKKQIAEQPAPAPSPKKHIVDDGETLIDIAKKYNTTWQRIYAKNPHVEHPDIVKPGVNVTIPLPDEELKQRDVPEPPAPAPSANRKPRNSAGTNRQAQTNTAPRVTSSFNRGSSAGNTYYHGYCTWYVKNRRPDLPNNLGNAITWVSRARAQGISTGSSPRVGAVGQRGNHVAYVEAVNGDGTVTVSEMNYRGWNVVSSRTVPASYFQYIY